MAVRTRKAAAQPEARSEPKFTKQQILASEKFAASRDLAEALLSDGETYSAKAVVELIEKYKKGQVD